MHLHHIRLRGFRGIRDGLGREELSLDLDRLCDGAALVALTGANGRGKTTVLDNLHPYLTMPSRSGASGAGAFSYYDHVYLPESEKTLVWSQDGQRYRSHVVIRSNGRRRTEAFVFAWEGGRWTPLVLADGTVSDGKVETYTRCVESLCGSAETFFTSAFSAQGQRQLSHYRNGEIKSLLADLLGQDELRQWAQRGGEVVRLLKAGLSVLRGECDEAERTAIGTAQARERLAAAPDRVARCLAERNEADEALRFEQERHAACLAERQQAAAGEQRREQLQGERTSIIAQGRAAITALDTQDQREAERAEALRQRIELRITQARARRDALRRQIDRFGSVLGEMPAVRRAMARLPLAERVEAARERDISAARSMLAEWQSVGHALAANRQRLTDLEQAAGHAVLKAEDLRRRFGLTAQVPCAGSDLQTRCPLLGDAHQAQALIPSAQSQVQRLAEDRQRMETEHADLVSRHAALAPASERLRRAERRHDRSRVRARQLAAQVTRRDELERARVALAEAEQALAALPAQNAQPDEEAEQARVREARRVIAAQRSEQAAQYRQRLDAIEQALRALPPSWSPSQLADSEVALARARTRAQQAADAHLAAIKDAQSLEALDQQARSQARRRRALHGRVTRIEDALRSWNLFVRCMGNDGLIALAIDDAGPALAGLANALLLACYGPRFTLSMRTLVASAKGDTREGFEIDVHDAESGQTKPVTLASGGERVWINACLTRAVALYLAQQAGRRYATLFSDEADGALDPERKRMWMTMKREVLRQGHYAREYFISQTPELAAMADAVIDLDAMAASAAIALPASTALPQEPDGRRG